MSKIIPYFLALFILISCAKPQENTAIVTSTSTSDAEKSTGVYVGLLTVNKHNSVNYVISNFDTSYTSSITVSLKSADSIRISAPDMYSTSLLYKGHKQNCGYAFFSHPGGHEFKFIYNPDTDSVYYSYSNYSTGYATPGTNNSNYLTFAGKRQ